MVDFGHAIDFKVRFCRGIFENFRECMWILLAQCCISHENYFNSHCKSNYWFLYTMKDLVTAFMQHIHCALHT